MLQIWGFCFYSADMIPWGEAIGVSWLVNQMHFSVLYGLVRHGGGGMKLLFLFVSTFSKRCARNKGLN